jgi:hypothetical protein
VQGLQFDGFSFLIRVDLGTNMLKKFLVAFVSVGLVATVASAQAGEGRLRQQTA